MCLTDTDEDSVREGEITKRNRGRMKGGLTGREGWKRRKSIETKTDEVCPDKSGVGRGEDTTLEGRDRTTKGRSVRDPRVRVSIGVDK